jgi:uncharacterized protein (TIGR02996 family)
MLIVFVRAGDQPARRYVFPGGSASLCRGTGLEIRVTRPNLHEQIASVSVSNGRLQISVIGEFDVYVNDRHTRGSLDLIATDEVRILGTRLSFATGPHPAEVERAPFVAHDDIETQLIAQVAAGDATARLVYIDWLEQRGHGVRAAFLRAQECASQLGHDAPGFADLGATLGALASQTPVGWRARLATARIEACDTAFDFQCPKQWTQLAETVDPMIRRCGVCRRDAHYALSVGEARHHAGLGRCVALDPTSPRLPDDLAPPFGSQVCDQCDADLGRGFSFTCEHCGATQEPPGRGLCW